MERGFKYRIYPNESQRDQIARTLGCCRFVYNRALDVKKSAYAKTGKTVSWAELSRMLPAWKRNPETSWLAQVDSMALQQSIRDLDRAYKNFFRRVREGGKPGFPKFKSRRHARQSYRTNGGKVLDRNHIALPKLGNVRAKVSRPLQGRFISVTVSMDAAGRYFATFLCTDVPAKDTTATDREVGIDLGVETLVTLSDGTKIENPRHLKKYERKLAREQRRLSRRKGARRGEKPSGRYLKQRKRVAMIHAKIADARTDALHKVTTMLADENQVLCMEDLNAKGMMKNHHLAKAVTDASFGEFARLLEYKCAERGRTLVRVDRFYPSSKTCSACGHRLDALPLSVRTTTATSMRRETYWRRGSASSPTRKVPRGTREPWRLQPPKRSGRGRKTLEDYIGPRRQTSQN